MRSLSGPSNNGCLSTPASNHSLSQRPTVSREEDITSMRPVSDSSSITYLPTPTFQQLMDIVRLDDHKFTALGSLIDKEIIVCFTHVRDTVSHPVIVSIPCQVPLAPVSFMPHM
ncbi:hypothetical protein BO94DRAFT_544564 [Aspergillus sclerotioniger CBS 115572]|uniref:Uncharacterized protein n=1 Tax=Aspergillus sclerotioniger CBS 115572 TaxID=1450535 RepID=A0A317X2M1_9EURO|nr:hypothetical protein BO94DRAFT_544564 [Aspergillus sclerotioniger CBS 115572]PWY91862.1 hypothetical protein BO94DRAFT_544564 [Aspergillus sclerotioniger CBS 115572]